MRFKTDENIPVGVVRILTERGHDAHSVVDQLLDGHPGADVATVGCEDQRALVTLDLDFSDVRLYPPEQYPGLVILRPGLRSISAIELLAEQLVDYLSSQTLSGHLWIVEEHRLRIRGM